MTGCSCTARLLHWILAVMGRHYRIQSSDPETPLVFAVATMSPVLRNIKKEKGKKSE